MIPASPPAGIERRCCHFSIGMSSRKMARSSFNTHWGWHQKIRIGVNMMHRNEFFIAVLLQHGDFFTIRWSLYFFPVLTSVASLQEKKKVMYRRSMTCAPMRLIETAWNKSDKETITIVRVLWFSFWEFSKNKIHDTHAVFHLEKSSCVHRIDVLQQDQILYACYDFYNSQFYFCLCFCTIVVS